MKNISLVKWTFFALMIALTATGTAYATDFLIVPGQKCGRVTIGEGQKMVVRDLGRPGYSIRDRVGDRIDVWLSPSMLRPTPDVDISAYDINRHRPIHRNSFSVFFRNGRAVQLEVTSNAFATASGLTTESDVFSKWQKTFSRFVQVQYMWLATNPLMASPACKHVLVYGDDIEDGIAWKRGAWGCAAPEPGNTLEAVVVHRPGRQVLLNPNDARDYAGLVRPGQ